jgi:hypothetical protein
MAYSPNENQRRALATGVAFMTAWTESPDHELSHALLGDAFNRGDEGIMELLTGVTNVAGGLLIALEEMTGKPAIEILREFALRFPLE